MAGRQVSWPKLSPREVRRIGKRLLHALGGHPFVVQAGLRHLQPKKLAVAAELVDVLARPEDHADPPRALRLGTLPGEMRPVADDGLLFEDGGEARLSLPGCRQ